MSEILFTNQVPPTTPGAGTVFLFVEGGLVKTIDSAGTVTTLGAGGDTEFPYIVGKEPGLPYSSIQTAIDAAAAAAVTDGRSKDVFVRPGQYTEDLTFKANVHVIGAAPQSGAQTFSMQFDGPKVVGNHVVEVSVAYKFIVRGIHFVDNDLTTPVVSLSGVGSGGNGVFDNCLLEQSGASTAPVIYLDSTHDASRDDVSFTKCVVRGLSTTTFAVELDGSTAQYDFRDCLVACTNPPKCISLGASHGITPAEMALYGTYVFGSIVLDANGVVARIVNSEVVGSATAPAIDIGNTSSAQVDRCVLKSDHTEVVSGQGSLNITATSVATYSGGYIPFGTALGVNVGSRLLHSQVRSLKQSIATSGTTGVSELTKVVQVDTTAAAGAVTADLPDPADLEGQIMIVWDSGNAATTHTITITCAAASIVGKHIISTNGGRLSYIACDGVWLQFAHEN